jgi:hypothetical protein
VRHCRTALPAKSSKLAHSGSPLCPGTVREREPAEQDLILKAADVHYLGKQGMSEMEKWAYQAGAEAADQMAGAGMAGNELPQDYSGDQVQDTDIVSVIQQLVESGALTEEQAMTILQQAGMGGGAGGAGAGGGAPEGGHAEPDGDEDPAMKEARTLLKSASAVLATL